jgi:hypothetical protein
MCTKTVALLAASLVALAGGARADLSISNKPTQNMDCQAGVCTATARKAVLNVGDLQTMLASGDVKVTSGNLAQDIEIDAPVSWTSTHRLTLDSYRAIAFNRPVLVAGSPGALTIITDGAGSGGDFHFFGKGHIEFWDLTSSLIINGNSYRLVRSIRKLDRVGAFVALAKSIDAGKTVYNTSPIQFFSATLDGLGNTISHLTIHAGQGGGGGLIGILGEECSKGLVRDIGLLSVDMMIGNTSSAGALVATNLCGTISNSYATGQISGSSNSVVGGLVASSSGTIIRSYAAVTVSGGDDSIVGGLVGSAAGEQSDGLIDQSSATGMISGGDRALVGGLAGRNVGGMISNSYAAGAVTGGGSALVGGLIGNDANYFGAGFLRSSYSTGAANGGPEALLGGLIGDDESSNSINDAYWDLETSGITDPSKGAGNIANDPGITGLSDAQLKFALPHGFDSKIWGSNPNINKGYPYLRANPPQ